MPRTVNYKQFSTRNTINAKLAEIYVEIPNSTGSKVRMKVASAENIAVNIDVATEDVQTLGDLQTHQVPVGATITGTMTVKQGSSIWSKMIRNYVKNGKITYFDVNLIQYDPKNQTYISRFAKNCLLTGTVPFMAADVGVGVAKVPLSFSVDDLSEPSSAPFGVDEGTDFYADAIFTENYEL
jgi:hypothetical protein